MTYKELNVYQRAYRAAIDLHSLIEGDNKFSDDEIRQLNDLSRSITSNIAEGFSQRTAKAKRFFNFKAMDSIRQILMDLDFLHDTERLSPEDHKHLYEEYEICVKQLFKYNQSILEKAKEKEAEPVAA